MDRYIPNIIKILGVLIIMFAIYFFSYKVHELSKVKYEKENNLIYVYDIFEKQIINKENAKEENNKEYDVLETFVGRMTGYGPDCAGCSGITSYGHDLRNGNVTYYDEEFKETKIVAADSRYPFGTIVRVSGLSVYDKPFIAIVLDRGGKINDNLMDLAFDTEDNPLVRQIGYSKNITYEILRYGW